MPNNNYREFLQEVLETVQEHDTVRSGDIPPIDLYMDQVTTFMDEHLGVFMRDSQEKTLTKTMINNYSKCGILPPSAKKKYSTRHIVLLLMVYHMKHVLSIPDIQELLAPVKERLLKPSPTLSLEAFYDRILEAQKTQFPELRKQLDRTLDSAQALFSDVEDPEEQELFSLFAASYLLSMEAATLKHLVARLIDRQPHRTPPKKSPDKKA
ncbi:DUF1836 domain-containing protein [Anaerotalea alkaliphila]|uniref:DUF1836 domain-containing protein n=1 Tax=Anaerotalea alkaliphila TaxID=2662126 RepID=A0A7X5HU91_9FIRM|nr:DUF1836 domain-containing protein [Anaerotalea alkaliphila]NDL66670.1 DUF1836 domain-containing protein [Anaerotalea alkaliphila]